MVKSLKKAIAVGLSALMVACTMPFTALAAAGDYNPDIQVQFNAVIGDSWDWVVSGDPTAPLQIGGGTLTPGYGACGIEAPILKATGKVENGVYKVSGLTLKKSDTDNSEFAVYNEMDALDEDYVYGEGDLVAVTIKAKNVTRLFTIAARLNYSDNIEPAGVYATGTKASNAKTFVSTLSKKPSPTTAKNANGFDEAVSTTKDWYDGIDIIEDTENAYFDAENRIISVTHTQGSTDDVSKINLADPLVDIETGDPLDYTGIVGPNATLGYDYAGELVMETFIFMITGEVSDENPIEFKMDDPDGTKYPGFQGGYYINNKADGTSWDDYTTYAPNGTNPGSQKMTFMQDIEEEKEEEHKHSYSSKVVAPTCTSQGYTEYTCANTDNKCTQVTYKDTYTDPVAENHKWGETPVVAEVPATYTSTGTKAIYACEYNPAHTKGGETINKLTCTHPAANVSIVGAVTGTCLVDGYTGDKYCSQCQTTFETGKNTGKAGHVSVSANNAVAPTVAKDGKESDTKCSVCKNTLTTGKTIPAIGVKVTVDEEYINYGTVKVQSTKNAAENVVYGTEVTMTATPVSGAEFVGYEVAGKLVSNEATYTFVARQDVTVKPVFTKATTDTITVVFYDTYANVVDFYNNVKVADFQAAMAEKIPVGPEYARYTFKGWSYTDEQLKNLDKSTTVWGIYEENVTGFTVTTDAEVTIDCDYANGQIPFDAKVTVSAPNAKAWKVGDTIVSYDATYTFYVGADIDVRPVYDSVGTAKPTVVMVNHYQLDGSHKVTFVANVKIPDNFTLVDHGFIYGKALTDAELNMDMVGQNGAAVNAGVVKMASLGASDLEQFAISYGVTAKNANACAKGYVVYADADNNMTTIYTDAVIYAYN